MKAMLEAAKAAKFEIARLTSQQKNAALNAMADALIANEAAILAANAVDMAAARGVVSDVMLDRLLLTPERIAGMAKGIRDVINLPDPVGLLLDEHTAALDPKTAAKVLDATQRIVERDKLTTIMITHNMRDAIAYGNRLIMMYNGHIVVDISGEEKKNLTVEQLLNLFSQASGSDEVDDKLVLS